MVRVFRNTLIPSVKMTLTMNKIFAGIICQTIEREVDYSTAKKGKLFCLLFPKDPNKSKLGSSPGSSSSAIITLSSAGILPVVSRTRTLQCITALYVAPSLDLIWQNDIIVE